MKSTTRPLAVSLALGIGLTWAQVLPAEKAVPDLSGTWKIDEELSEDPLAKVRLAIERRSGDAGSTRPSAGVVQGGSGGYPGPPLGVPQAGVPQGRVPQGGVPQGGVPQGGGTSSSGTGSSGVAGDPGISAEMKQRFETLEESRWQIQITQGEDDVTLRFGDGEEIRLPTNGKATRVETPRGSSEMSARWKKNGRLVIKNEISRQNSIETYQLGAEGKLLTVVTEVDLGRLGWVTYRWLYRPRTVVEKAVLVDRN